MISNGLAPFSHDFPVGTPLAAVAGQSCSPGWVSWPRMQRHLAPKRWALLYVTMTMLVLR